MDHQTARTPGQPLPPLYLITDDASPARLPSLVAAALKGAPPGSVLVQLRAKSCSAKQLHDMAWELRAHCAAHQAGLLINDRADLAQLVCAAGVHLPEQGLPPSAARALLGAHALVGVSCHDAAGLAAAADGGASFATLSPVFPSPNKGAPLGLVQFAALTRASNVPVYALGGVSAAHAAALKQAGAAGLAVISAAFKAADPARAVEALLDAWHAAP